MYNNGGKGSVAIGGTWIAWVMVRGGKMRCAVGWIEQVLEAGFCTKAFLPWLD